MKQPDWSTAPEGATHFHPGNDKYVPHWYKEGYFCVIGHEGGGWVKDLLPQPTSAMIPRPTTPQWNGEGLPPVGVVCEVMSTTASGEWLEAMIVAHDGDKAVYRLYDGSYGGDLEFFEGNPARTLFRPIRTPEQIAAEERENELNRMVATVSMLDKGWARKVCAGLYDAGYRMTAEDER